MGKTRIDVGAMFRPRRGEELHMICTHMSRSTMKGLCARYIRDLVTYHQDYSTGFSPLRY